jgi:DNA-binding GntR family transcriptional regulator
VDRRRTGAGRSPEPVQDWLVALIDELRLSSGAHYRDLAAGLRAAILRGDVPAGTRLPPQRELAELLSIGRTTVVGAYNLLCGESLLEMKQGAGTWVVRDRAPRRGRSVRS